MDDTKSREVKITSSGAKHVPKAADILTRTFTEDPAITFMLSSLSDEQRLAYLPTYMHSLVKAASLNSGIFEEANDWSCCAIWMPPGKRVDNPWTFLQAGMVGFLFKIGISGIKRMLSEFVPQSDACKAKGLVDSNGKKITRYWYLFFIATDFYARGQGIASKVVAKWQEKAAADDLPIWLEATTKHSRDIYERLGFEEVQEMRLGRGTHAPSGRFEKGGEGVSIWAMVWKPEQK